MTAQIHGRISPTGPHISHYYGDYVRVFLLSAAALVIVSAPFYADNLHAELPFEVVGAIVVAGFAALTNPRSRSLMNADAFVSAIGFVIFALWGLSGYENISLLTFMLRLVIAALFLFAFYYSVKTVRAMIFRSVGTYDSEGEQENLIERVIEDIEMTPRDTEAEEELETAAEEGNELEDTEDTQALHQRGGGD